MLRSFCLLAALLGSSLAHASPEEELRRSHIEAHLPPAAVFQRYLQRDVAAWFKRRPDPGVTRAETTLLRDGPTQSGVAYPKWYVWTRVYAGNTLRHEGALRVASVERHFEVTDFAPRAGILDGSSDVRRIFPAALVPAIVDLAKAPALPGQHGKVVDKKIQ